MADEKEPEGVGMKDLTSTSFGYIIAFLLPGLLALYALSFWSVAVAHLLDPALRAEATVGPSVILILMALGVGLCVSSVRFFVFERFLCHNHKFPADMFAKLVGENKLTSFRAVVDEHYRYHQFYGGFAIGLAILYVGWVRQTWIFDCHFISITFAFLLIESVLSKTAIDAFQKYIQRGKTIVNG